MGIFRWRNALDGLFTTASNWDPGAVPGLGDDAVLGVPTAGGANSYNLENSNTIQLEAYFSAGGGTTVTVGGTLLNTGAINLLGGANALATPVVGTARNARTIALAAHSVLTVGGAGAHVQTAGLTAIDGRLDAALTTWSGGVLDGTGAVGGSVANAGGAVIGGDVAHAC